MTVKRLCFVRFVSESERGAFNALHSLMMGLLRVFCFVRSEIARNEKARSVKRSALCYDEIAPRVYRLALVIRRKPDSMLVSPVKLARRNTLL